MNIAIFALGEGVIVTQIEDKIGKGAPDRKRVPADTSFHLPARLVHRLFNTGTTPLTLFFDCPKEHMSGENPVRTVVKDFGVVSS